MEKKILRDSVLMEYLRDDRRILNVLEDLMGLEIPEDAEIQILQYPSTLNPVAFTHMCVLINEDAYLILEEPAVLDDQQLGAYVRALDSYEALLEEKEIQYHMITPIIFSNTGIINASICMRHCPAHSLISHEFKYRDCDFDINEDDECDEEFDEDFDDDLAEEQSSGIQMHEFNFFDRRNEADDEWDKNQINGDLQAELLHRLRPDLSEEEIDAALIPHKGVYIAIMGGVEFYIFDIYTSMHPDYDNENFALDENEDLYCYATGRMIVENDMFGRSAHEDTISAKEYLADPQDDDFCNFLNRTDGLQRLHFDILLTHYTWAQRQGAIECFTAKKHERALRGYDVW